METTDLKSLWQSIPSPAKKNEQLVAMLKENNQPVLQGIKKQLLLEGMGFLAFLACYYTMFDGAQKPIWLNLTLLLAICTPILHHIKSYQFYQSKIDATNLKVSLGTYLGRLNNYVVHVLVCRIVFAFGLLFFFSYNLNFNLQKWAAIAAIVFVFGIQLSLLYKVWANRIKQLKANIEALDTQL